MSISSAGPQVPINRTLVGILALVCGAIGGLMALSEVDPSTMWQGAFLRVSIVLAAFWLALPSRTQEAAWARIPLWQLVSVLLTIVVVARMRISPQLLIGGLLVFGAALMLLRPRRRTRPAQRLFD